MHRAIFHPTVSFLNAFFILLSIPAFAPAANAAANTNGWKIQKVAYAEDTNAGCISVDAPHQFKGNCLPPNYVIYLVDAPGAHPRELANGVSPELSPDGSLVAYCRQGLSTASQIEVIHTDGTGRQQLTNDPAGACDASWSPAWSPDGKSIAYTKSVPGTSGNQVYVLHPGAQPEFLVAGANPQWSSDGSQVLFTHRKAVWIAQADGKSPIKIYTVSDDSVKGLRALWSYDGKSVVVSLKEGHSFELIRVRPDGTALEKIAAPKMRDMEFLGFSPDEKQFITMQQRIIGGSSGNPFYEPIVVLVDGQKDKMITPGFHPSIVWQPN